MFPDTYIDQLLASDLPYGAVTVAAYIGLRSRGPEIKLAQWIIAENVGLDVKADHGAFKAVKRAVAAAEDAGYLTAVLRDRDGKERLYPGEGITTHYTPHNTDAIVGTERAWGPARASAQAVLEAPAYLGMRAAMAARLFYAADSEGEVVGTIAELGEIIGCDRKRVLGRWVTNTKTGERRWQQGHLEALAAVQGSGVSAPVAAPGRGRGAYVVRVQVPTVARAARGLYGASFDALAAEIGQHSHLVMELVTRVQELRGIELTEQDAIDDFLRPLVVLQRKWTAKHPEHAALVTEAINYAIKTCLSDAHREILTDGDLDRWFRYSWGIVKNRISADLKAVSQREAKQATPATVDSLLALAAELNADGNAEQADQVLTQILTHHLDEAAQAFDGDRDEARRHVMEAYNRGLDDYVCVEDYAPACEYLPGYDFATGQMTGPLFTDEELALA